MSSIEHRTNDRTVNELPRLTQSMQVYIAAVVIVFLSHIPTAFSQSAAPITWSAPALSRWFFPGQTYQTSLTFTSSAELRELSVFVVPELQPFVTVRPSFFPHVTTNTPYTATVTVTIPTDSPLGLIYSGTVHLRTNLQTVPQTFKISFEVLPAGFEPVDSRSVVQDSDGSIVPVTDLLVQMSSDSTFRDAVTVAQNIGGSVIGDVARNSVES